MTTETKLTTEEIQTNITETTKAMSEALQANDMDKVLNLANNLKYLKKQELTLTYESQKADRNEFMVSMTLKLKPFHELASTIGCQLKVTDVLQADGSHAPVVSITPDQELQDEILNAAYDAEQPSTLRAWTFDQGVVSVGTGGTVRTLSVANGGGTKGWRAPNGEVVSLGQAFDRFATDAQKVEAKSMTNNQSNQLKQKVVKEHEYIKV